MVGLQLCAMDLLWPLKQLFQPVHSYQQLALAAAISTVIFVAIFALLHRLPAQGKKWLTIICTFVAGLYFLLEYTLPTSKVLDPETGNYTDANFITGSVKYVSYFFSDIMIWTLLLGLISLTLVHGRRLLRRQSGWHYSLAFFLALIGMLLFGFWSQFGDATVKVGEMDVPTGATLAFTSLYNGLFVNINSTMFALLAFYIASAAYRAFRVRSAEAALLMFAALIVMLGVINPGVALTGWIPDNSPFAFLRLDQISQFLQAWVNMPAYRAVQIGVAIGSLAMAMRLWLSLERGAFFSEEG